MNCQQQSWPHFTPGKDPVPILQEAGWGPGPVWTEGKSRPHRDWTPDRPACSQSLYRMSYPAHTYIHTHTHIYIYIRSVYVSEDIILHLSCEIQLLLHIQFFVAIYTGRFIMYSWITKIYYRKTVGHIFTKPVQIEGTTQKMFFRTVSCFSS